MGGVCDLNKHSYGLVPLVRIAPVSGLELDLGGLIFNGGAGSVFGILKDIKEMSFGIRYRF